MRHESPSAFLNATALEPAYTSAELRLPPDINEPTQPYNIPTGTHLVLLDVNKRKFGTYLQKGVETHDLRGRVHVLLNTMSENILLVSDYQLAEMERAGRFYPRDSGLVWEPPDISLDEANRIVAERNLSYVIAVQELAAERQVEPRKGLIEEAAASHALAIGDAKPLT